MSNTVMVAIPTYKKVRAVQTFKTTAVMPFQNNKQVDFTIYKDSIYNVVEKNGDYEVNMGPYLVSNAPKEIFEAYMPPIAWGQEILLLLFIFYLLSSPFWLPKVFKHFIANQ